MRILTVLTYYYPHWTGLTAYAQRLAEGLAARGHRVTVVTCRYRNDLPREETHNGVSIVRVPTVARLSRGQVMPTLALVVGRLAREHDVVHTHSPMLETWLVGCLAHRAGRRMLMTHHGDLVMPAGTWNQVVQRTVGFMLDQAASVADVITVYSRDYAEHSDYLRPYAHKVEAIYPPVEIPEPDLGAVAAWRRELGLERTKLVGFAGRFVEETGFDYLLRAIPLIAEKIPTVKFAFAGEHRVVYEDFFRQCRHLIEAHNDRLIMLGLITDRQRLADFYAMCDLFVLPSRTDCFALVQVEAMLCGTPVVATNIPGAREAVSVTNMGLLVDAGSEQALAAGIVEVLNHRQDYVQDRERICSIFDKSKTLAAYEQLLESTVGSP